MAILPGSRASRGRSTWRTRFFAGRGAAAQARARTLRSWCPPCRRCKSAIEAGGRSAGLRRSPADRRRPVARGAGRLRRDADRQRHGHAGGGAVQAADGDRLPHELADLALMQRAAAAALGRPAQHPVRRIRRAGVAAGTTPRPQALAGAAAWNGCDAPEQNGGRAGQDSRALHDAAAARHRHTGHRCHPESPCRLSLQQSRLALDWDPLGLMAGVDEAGRGPLAGPVVAAAVILDDSQRIRGLADSKVLTPLQRDRLYDQIRAKALCCSVGEASVEEIDTLNILHATMLAMRRAVEGLRLKPVKVLVDGNRLPKLDVLCRGDRRRRCARCKSISAASILAKVHARPLLRAVARRVSAVRLCRAQGLRHAGAPGGAARARRLPAPPAALRPVAAGVTASSTASAVIAVTRAVTAPAASSSRSRDNALLKDLRRLAQDSTAYRKQGRVWLEGDHLCRAALRARRAAGHRGVSGIVVARSRRRSMGTAAAEDRGDRRRTVRRASAAWSRRRAWASCCRCRRRRPLHAGVATRGARSACRTRATSAPSCAAPRPSASARCSRSRARRRCGRPRCCVRAWARISGCAWSKAWSLATLAALQVPLLATSSHQRRVPAPGGAAVALRLGAGPRRAGRQRRRWRRRAAQVVRIAQPGGEESLNVAAAAAICLHASARRMRRTR